MKKKIIGLFSILPMVIFSLFFLLPSSIVYSATSVDIVNSNYLINGTPYLSNVVAGTTSGYGSFPLGEENITLTASANSGFKLVGWLVQYNDEDSLSGEQEQYIDSTNLIDNQKIVVIGSGENEIQYTLTFTDSDQNGDFDSGSFSISRVFENINVSPVFDYVYFNLDITENIDLFNLDNNITTTYGQLYYSSSEEVENITLYSNSILKVEEKYYFYSDVYSNGEDFYTIHFTSSSEPTEQLIDLSVGAYRSGQKISASLSVKNEMEIDVNSIEIIENDESIILNEQTDLNANSGYKLTKNSDTKLVENIEFSYNIQITNGHTSYIKFNFAPLYKASINITINGEPATQDEKDMIMPLITSTDYYSVIDATNGIYYVKNSSDNNGISYRVTAPSRVSRVIDGIQYNYYTFASLNGSTNNSYLFSSDITEDFIITIDFVPSEYQVSFEFMQYNRDTNELIKLDEDFNVEQSFTLMRGESKTITKSTASDNIGYEFYGFAFNTISISQNDSIQVQISADKPTDITILMLFEKIDYTIILSNYDAIKLNYNSTDICPINNLELTRTRGELTSSASVASEALREGLGTYTFSTKFNINDSVKLQAGLNAGFKLLGYKFDIGSAYYTEANELNFIFNAEFIQTYDQDNDYIINIYVYEDFEAYTYSFYILAQEDSALNQNVIMADLSINYNGEIFSTIQSLILANDNVSISVTESEARITITNLKLYDTLVLSAIGKQRQDADDYYLFVRMTEDDRTNYTPDSYTDTEVSYTATILKNNTNVKVVYSMPSTLLVISADLVGAYDFTKLAVYESETEFGAQTLIYSNSSGSTNIQVPITVGNYITVKLNVGYETISELFNFGYTLKGYTFILTNEDPIYEETTNLSYSYFADSTSIQRLVINIATIEYRVSVQQFYDNGVEIGYVGFGSDESQNYKIVTVNDGLIEFVMGRYIGGASAHFDEGAYYASAVYFVKNGDHEYEKMEQTNEYHSVMFSYNITSEELLELSRTYDVTDGYNVYFNIKVVYSIHTYNVSVQYALTNPKNETYDNRVNFPSMVIEYLDETTLITINPTRAGNTITFSSIPHGVVPTLKVAENVPSGMSAFGFTIDSNNTRPDKTEFNYSTTSLSFIRPIIDNYSFFYKLTYDSYAINTVILVNGEVVSSGGEIYGDPEVLVNNKQSNLISLYDNLKINMNAQTGYKFDNLTYKRSVLDDLGVTTIQDINYSCFLPYQYMGEADWNRNYLLLYTYNENSKDYVRNTSKEYDQNITYYKSNINYYEDLSFSIDNYVLADGYITFYIEYSYADYVIINTNTNYGETNYSKDNTDVQISPEQYSTFSIFVTTADGTKEISPTDTINSSARTIEIRISMNYTPEAIDGTYYDLSLGLRLMRIYMFGEMQSFTMLETGLYSFTFNFSDVIDRIADGILDISYRYQAENMQITLSTNIDSESFYYRDGASQFVMFYHNETYNYGGEAGDNNNMPAVTDKLYYLAKAEFGYTNNHSMNFEVTGLKAYLAQRSASGELMYDDNGNLIAGDEIPVSQYAYYGIILNDPMGTSFALRFITNMVVELQVQPIIHLNGADGHVFTNTFICDSYGIGIPQTLTTGTSSGQIQADIDILNYLQIRYFDENTGLYTTSPTNVGRYKVYFSLDNTTGDPSYDWMESIEFLTDVYLVIEPKEVNLTYSLNTKFSKTYDGSDVYNVDNLLRYLMITDGGNLNISLNGETEFTLNSTLKANITYSLNGEQIATANANENMYYNIFITGISLYNNKFNNNFVLSNNTLVMMNVIQIMRKELTLRGVSALDKVYDGNTNVNISTDSVLSYVGVVAGDSLEAPVVENLSLMFEDAGIGLNKNVIVDTSKILLGEDANNYKISNSSVRASIYPYSVSCVIDGIGTFTIYNERGLSDNTKANLIPINAKLNIEIISTESAEYANAYPIISQYLVNNRIVVYGLRIRFEIDGVQTNINNELMLSIPTVDRYTGTLWLSGDQAGEVDSTQSDGTIVIDLSNINYNLDRLIITQQRELFAIWQIVLIILSVIVLIAVIIIVILVVRKRKREMYDKLDKI